MSDAVIWHDVECASYDADLTLWRELAARADGPVLDVGAGTGRVTLDLASRGMDVTALDAEAELLDALNDRAAAAGVPVATAVADARDFDLGRRFNAVLVPMQTVQLLDGPSGRMRFLACAQAHLNQGGFLAIAIADALEGFDEQHTEPPLPDIREVDGTVFASRPVAVRELEDGVSIERIREKVSAEGDRTVTANAIRLDRLDAATLEAEAKTVGLAALPPRVVAATEDYVGSTVVMLGA